jgi:truncated hemoglobin YjbI
MAIIYELAITNSGSVPAKSVRIEARQEDLERALGVDATPEHRRMWLACFADSMVIPVLQT